MGRVRYPAAAGGSGQTQAQADARYPGIVDTVAALKALPAPSGAQRVFVAGYSSALGGGGGEFRADLSDTTTAENGGTVFVGTGGTRWKRVYNKTLTAMMFGAGFGGDDTARLQALAAATPSLRAHVVFEPVNYNVNGTVGFNVIQGQFEARGATFTQTGTANLTVDLNNLADAAETVKNHNVRWHGGWFTSSTKAAGKTFVNGEAYPLGKSVSPTTPNGHVYVVTVAGTAGAEPSWPTGSGATITSGGVTFQENGLENRNRGIRFASITRGKIEGVYWTEQGVCGLDASPVDGLTVFDCHGFNNNRHIRVPDLFTGLGDPQSYWIDNCGFSIHHTAGIEIQKTPNVVNITNTYGIGDDCVLFVTGGPPAELGRALKIDGCTFEQPGTGFYIRSTNPYSQTLYGLSIINSDFDFATAKIASIDAVNGFRFEGNTVFSSQTGWLTLGAACQNVYIGPNNFVNLPYPAGSITASCPPYEIRIDAPQSQLIRREFHAVDDFMSKGTTTGLFGDWGWNFAGGTAGVAANVFSNGRVGIARRDTGTVAGTLAYTHTRQSAATGIVHTSNYFDFLFDVMPQNADAETLLRFGGSLDPSANPSTDGVYFEKLAADTNWFAVCRAASVETRTSMGVAVSTAGFVRLRVRRVNSTQIGFSIDGGTETLISTNVPVQVVQQFFQILNTSTNSKRLDIDFAAIDVYGLAR